MVGKGDDGCVVRGQERRVVKWREIVREGERGLKDGWEG